MQSQWNARRAALIEEIARAARELLKHTRADTALIPLGQDFYVAIGPAEQICMQLDCDDPDFENVPKVH
jgi:hypothetical protein